jgi:uncharacterized protein YndB with AHSA1/START domain
MTGNIKSVDDLLLNITQEIHVNASIEKTFESLLEQLGPSNETPDGKPLAMKIEAWPGGRWYRDLGDSNGHFWGNVQAIKRPTLLEITGPLFASTPFVSNVQYRLSEQKGGTLISFHHIALGVLTEEHRKGVQTGWASILNRIKARTESSNSRSASVQ